MINIKTWMKEIGQDPIEFFEESVSNGYNSTYGIVSQHDDGNGTVGTPKEKMRLKLETYLIHQLEKKGYRYNEKLDRYSK